MTAADGLAGDGWLRLERDWRPGDTVTLDLELAPRLTLPSPRADAVRGCAAIERGPLVYCVERVDQPEGTRLDDIRLEAALPLSEHEQPDLLGGVVTVGATARVATPAPAPGDGGWWPYTEARTEQDTADAPDARPFELTAVPYHLWAHREEGPMRVWIPLARDEADGSATRPASGPVR